LGQYWESYEAKGEAPTDLYDETYYGDVRGGKANETVEKTGHRQLPKM
jgi:hypothetical protein